MKFTLALVLTISTFSAFAANLTTTIANIESEHNARCTRTGGSLFNLCSGAIPSMNERAVPYTCVYSVKYKCLSNEGDFRLKVRVKESYNHRTLERESRVTKVIFK